MADASKTVAIIFEGETSSAEASVGRLNNALGRVIEEEQRLASASRDASQQIDQVGAQSEQAAQQVGQLEDSTKRTAASADTLGNALRAVATSLVIKDWIDANANAEQFRLTMAAVTGDTAAAGREFEYIREVSQRMGLEVRSASESYARLASATKGTALEGDGARVIFEAVAGTMSRLGLSATDVNGALVQVAQGISKGRFELEDLKSIAERMPGFFDQFAQSLGRTTPELFELVKQGKIGSAEFLTFATSLNESLGSAKFDTYAANLNRLRNSITEAFVTIGDAGVWQVFNAGINAATVSITGAVGFIKVLGETLGNIAYTISSGDWSGFGTRFDESLAKVGPALQRANEQFIGLADNTQKLGFNAVEAGAKLKDSLEGAGAAAQQSAEQILKAFDATLKTAESSESLAKATTDLVIAYSRGDITAEQFYTRLDDVQKKQLELDKAVGGATTRMLEQESALKKTTAETTKAKESAEKYALELEKIASNERIKLIESQIKLDIAEVEANAKIAVAAFESISVGIQSTGETLTDFLGILAGGTQDWATWRIITDEIAKESKRRDAAFELQERFINSQIENLQAKTRALESGNAIINIDGAGLQPHLEAFMWEILRTIQVRVNSDGLEMLVGV